MVHNSDVDKEENKTNNQNTSNSNSKSTPTTGDTLNSMDTVPTQEIDGDFLLSDTEDDTPQGWGKLFPVGASFTGFDLLSDSITFGRDSKCDYVFNSPAIKKTAEFTAYSKTHFKIIRETTSTGTHVFLLDQSSNGTFVNGEKVGKGQRQVLSNTDEIALAVPKNRAFVYMDHSSNGDDLPQEVKQKYTLTRTLGRGACGEVKLAFKKGTCDKFAVKILQKNTFTQHGKNVINSTSQVMSEVKILKTLKHPCIIRIEDVIDTEDTLYIFLDLIEGGELFDRVVSVGNFSEPVSKMLFFQMASAVKYLHDNGITHRDLKPENILLSSPDNDETLIKVTDFGLSKLVDAQTHLKTFCGTPNYLAPEIIASAGVGKYTKQVDCWSLGVILYICLVGFPPFTNDRTDMQLPDQIIGGHYEFNQQWWANITETAKDLIRKLLTVDPQERITVDEIMNHPWLKDEAMRKKCHKLMFPKSDGMVPPNSTLKRGRDGASGDGSPVKKKL